jgi:hypothetical protein
LLRHVRRQRFLIGQQQLLQITDVREAAAIRKYARGIDWQGIVESKRLLSVLSAAFDGGHVFIDSPIAAAPTAHNVETLEGKAGRFDSAVTGGATRIGAMLIQLLPHGDGAANIGLDSG